MRNLRTLFLLPLALLGSLTASAQATHPAVTRWIFNTTGITGRHYVSGNPTPLSDTAHANVQKVRYSTGNAYINCTGIPAYVIGPYLDRNPSQGTNRKYLFKIPLNPQPNTGTPRAVGMGNTGVLINGVPIYNYADGRSYNNQGVWHQNAVVFESAGFDCAKGHPSPVFTGGPGGTLTGGSYHHHQNPSAFNIARVPLSTVCNVYLADGLYVPDSTQHGPLIGFAFDGYPIYGGYGYANAQTPGALKRMVPSYRKRNITARTTLPNGSTASSPGPTLAAQPLGSYFEDFEFVANSGDLDEHNGRLCVTPEYPQGTYAYFATIDAGGNSVYPYILGQTYYGVVETSNFPVMGPNAGSTSVVINEPVTTYTPTPTGVKTEAAFGRLAVFPNPANDLLVVQTTVSAQHELQVALTDMTGRTVQRQAIYPGSTMCYFDVQALHSGVYFLRVSGGGQEIVERVVIE